MSSYMIVPGAIALPESTKARLKEQVKSLDLAIDKIFTRFEYYVYSEEPLSDQQRAAVTEFLTRDVKLKDIQIARHDVELRILPRLGTISPWASKATDLARNCGVEGISRIERGIYMALTPEKSFWSGSGLKDEHLQKFIKLVHDRMSQTVVVGEEFNPQALFVDLEPKPLRTVAILEEGASALEKANVEWSLALSDDEVEYLVDAFVKLQRNPTDVELMMFAQANSEHCRHKIFNAAWTVDGEAKDKTLFGMVRDTHKHNPRGTVVAYSDNAAIMEGAESTRFFAPKRADGSFVYQSKKRLTHTLMKVETHNHPTAVAPFPGASTGAGGEIRDEGATGRGANPKAGLTGYTVANLQLDNLKESWEQDSHGKPGGIASALDIMIQGPQGGAEFNNEFGRANILGYLRTYEQTVGGRRWGYQKPIMIAGGLGNIDAELCLKKEIPAGALLIQLGGPGMLIGMGGGAASSLSAGTNTEALDFDSVQRGNPEIERRAQEVINTCWQMFENNPIIAIHDVGAGGLSNAFPELVNDAKRGAIFDLERVHIEDKGMSAAEIWSNESQERYVLAIEPESLALFDDIARRERCPYTVVGVATEERVLRVVEGEGLPGEEGATSEQAASALRPVDVPIDVILGKTPKMHRDVQSEAVEVEPVDVVGQDLKALGLSVMRHPTVASKSFLITVGDRNVGGLTARDQLVGPWQVPVADCAVTLADFEHFHGEAMSMGERSPLAILDSAAASRMAIAESITNIVAADIKHLDGIKLSANWMAACGTPGQDAALYKAVQAASEFCQALDISIPVGKDSMSMRTAWTENRPDGVVEKEVTAPVSLVVTAFSQVEDVRKTLTPQLVTDQGPTALILIDLGEGKQRLGGSVLTHTLGQFGDQVPDIEDAEKLRTFFAVIRSLADEGTILAYHDRSDGGLFATVSEMAFAGHTGVSINVDMLTFDGAVQDWGDYKIRPEQVQVQRDESTIKALFNEELGAVIQVRAEDRDAVLQLLREVGLSLCSHAIGTLNDKDTIEVFRDGAVVLEYPRAELGAAWSEVGYEIAKLRENPITAKAEFERWSDTQDANPGLNAKVDFDPQEDIAAPYFNKGRPAVALIREQGLNSQVEMAWALNKAGFAVHDVHMTDILEDRIDLDDVQGLVASGGFTYGDVLGPGEGWAKIIRHNPKLFDQFSKFFARDDVFALGVSNGCQMMTSLSDIIPGTENWPRFTKNKSARHEARLLMVEVSDSNSIFFKGMAGTRAPIVVSHGAGFANFSLHGDLDNVISAMRYASNSGVITEAYPFNPSGSINGIAAVTTADGRFTAMMPHPERTVRRAMMSWAPESWGPKDSGGDQTPWMRMFMNARVFVD